MLFKRDIEFLGHLVSVQGVDPVPDKLTAIRDWPTPHCLRDVRAFFGLASYYRRFVRNFASIAEPLTRLTKKNTIFKWTDEAELAFCRLKQALLDASTLAFPVPGLPCILDTDASDVAVGAVLSQVVDGVERPIAFYSRIMNSAQRNYCPTRRELLAVIAALQHFRHYLLGTHVILRTDHHSLKWLKTFKRPEGILARWIETLAEFDYEIEHRPGRLHCNADGVSRPICKQCWGKNFTTPWIDEFERADELTAPLGIHALFVPTEVSTEELRELQREDPVISPLLDFLDRDVTPTRDDLRALPLESRNLWSQRPSIRLQDGILIRELPTHTQLVVPNVLQNKLFDTVHSGPLAAHLGAERMLQQLRQYYYWPGMRRDIYTWTLQCTQCQKSKPAPSRAHGHLQKVITGAPLDIVAVDILSGLPTSSEGSKYILVLTDYFTKWSEAYALPDAEAHTCMSAMYNGFFSRFGMPRQLHSDQGKNFESKLIHELCLLAGIEKSKTTPFHPRSDGQAERLNRTLLQMLRTTATDHVNNWPSYLPTVLSAYRMTVHSVTGITPNMAMLGREVLTPVTLIAQPPNEPVKLTIPYVTSFRNAMREAHNRIRESTHSVARTQKTYFDKYVKGPTFAVDQHVWLYWPRPLVRQKNKKLTQIWTGPWKITQFVSHLVVKIQHTRSNKTQTVHIDRLVPCNLPPPETEQETQETQPKQLVEPEPERRSTRARKPPPYLASYI